ncbi:hypothetical protein [Aquiflexum sp.]|uniref:hypothetical protein n=1 Tax=Aquiflexum sp. TaxID=1872584 RepID=UPI003593F667
MRLFDALETNSKSTFWKYIMSVFVLLFFQVNPLYSQIKKLPSVPKPDAEMIQPFEMAEESVTKLNDSKEVFSKIQSHKSEMDELKKETKSVKSLQSDSIRYDSLVKELKNKVLDQSKSQFDMLTELGEMVEDEGLKNSISYVKSNNVAYSQILNGDVDIEVIEDYFDFSEENMKALVDEHLIGMTSDPLEEFLGSFGIKEKDAITGRFYTSGLEDYLTKSNEKKIGINDLNKSEVQWKIIESGKEILPNELVGKGSNNKIQLVKGINKPKSELKMPREPNPYKGKSFFSRTNFGIYYDALQSISQGLHVQGHLGWRISNHVMPYAGMIFRKPWKEDENNSREGFGYQGGIRINFGNWFSQAGIEGTYSRNNFKGTIANEDFDGWILYPIFSGGRQVTITKSLRTVFLGYVDPLYTKNKTNRLHSHMFGLKIGIELN